MGYLLEGRVELTCQGTAPTVSAGQLIRLHSAIPNAWRNPGPTRSSGS